MSRFAGRGLELQELLQAVVRRWRGIRSVVLVDGAGLPLASSLGSRALEERLAALAAGISDLMVRSRQDLEVGAVHHLHLAGQDRQLIFLPVDGEAMLAAIVEADANSADVCRQLAATARHLLSGLGPPSLSPENALPPVGSEER